MLLYFIIFQQCDVLFAAPQSFSHHSGSMHPPQPSSTPTGSQPPQQHPAPSPGQVQTPY